MITCESTNTAGQYLDSPKRESYMSSHFPSGKFHDIHMKWP